MKQTLKIIRKSFGQHAREVRLEGLVFVKYFFMLIDVHGERRINKGHVKNADTWMRVMLT